MSKEQKLKTRAAGKCELCGFAEGLSVYSPNPIRSEDISDSAFICNNCKEQIIDLEKIDKHHWRCLNESAWSEVPAVQVLSWRMLNQLKLESWASDLLDMLYLDEETIEWAKEGLPPSATEVHKDCYGAQLNQGDNVVLIKSLDVKGTSLVAKKGTVVKNISLVADDLGQIEGRVEGQKIVILTKFLKRSG